MRLLCSPHHSLRNSTASKSIFPDRVVLCQKKSTILTKFTDLIQSHRQTIQIIQLAWGAFTELIDFSFNTLTEWDTRLYIRECVFWTTTKTILSSYLDHECLYGKESRHMTQSPVETFPVADI